MHAVIFLILMVLTACQRESAAPTEPPVPMERPTPAAIPPIGDGTEPLWQSVSRFFAPWILQDANSPADYMTLVTFDGDWNSLNNWDNTFAYPNLAHVYVSMSEDRNRYFLFYGVFHPRDWAYGPLNLADAHENDFEGAVVVVDKRFTTPTWPYGQVLTVETVAHKGYKAYYNCQLTGGYSLYVTLDPAFKSSWDGCITLTDYLGSPTRIPPVRTTPAPAYRLAFAIQPKTHAIYLRTATDPLADGRIHYYPTDNQAAQPTSISSSAPYRLQWITRPELGTVYPSMWSRRNLHQSVSWKAPFTNEQPVGPHDAVYFTSFGGNEYVDDFATAPWGFKYDDIAAVHVGDWHNHPAWAWAQHYRPVAGTTLYEYCRALSCRLNHTYVDNVFWEDTPLYSSTGEEPGCTDPTCLAPTPPLPRTRSPATPVQWHFNDGLNGVTVNGPGLEGVEAVSLPDTDWGYADGTVGALRVTGRGVVHVRLPLDGSAVDYDQVTIRLRSPRAAAVTPRATLGWQKAPDGSIPEGGAAALPVKYRKGGWEVRLLDLRPEAQWKAAGRLRFVILNLDLGTGPPQAVDIDFVAIAP